MSLYKYRIQNVLLMYIRNPLILNIGCYPEEADQCVQIFRNSLAEAASGEDEGFCDRWVN